ncbi:MAG TPA: hypothetical protein VEU97_01910 [Ktedonobacteraceae bacterium]|nr:hypothetical protein [Ktedonobacteraceae bacterium]
MLRRLPQGVKRILVPLVLALTLALALCGGASAHSVVKESAASHHLQPSTVIIYWYECGVGNNTCYGSINVTYHFTAHWNSGPFGSMGLTAFWGDGGSDYNLCGWNCSSGYASFSHFYNRSNCWDTWVGSSASGGYGSSNDVWMCT